MSDQPESGAEEKGNGLAILGKTLGFSLGLTLVFTLVTYLLPQVEGEAPEDKQVDLGALDMDAFVALGEDLFINKGTCTLCHKPPPLGRAPDIQGENMVALAEERLADPKYKGKAADTEQYIRESLVDTSIYVVAGWGKKGSNDTISPMPAIDKAPIELSEIEMDAIIAYLQAKDGNEITVSLPTEAPAVAEKPAPDSASAAAETPEEAVAKYGCQACHSMLGSEASLGPSLNDVGARLNKRQIVESILEPDAVISEGFTAGVMPKDFDKMTVKEMDLIVELLATLK